MLVMKADYMLVKRVEELGPHAKSLRSQVIADLGIDTVVCQIAYRLRDLTEAEHKPVMFNGFTLPKDDVTDIMHKNGYIQRASDGSFKATGAGEQLVQHLNAEGIYTFF